MWDAILSTQPHTIFQDFDLNMLAAALFAGGEEPFVVCAESSYGDAIVPAAIRRDGSISLLGEELFDYRCFLHRGDPEVLRAALARLAQLGRPLEIKALRKIDAASLDCELPIFPFCCAPAVTCQETTAENFAQTHFRLGRNLRRLAQPGFTLHRYNGDYPGLVRFIYQQKAAQSATSLFLEAARIEFMVHAAAALSNRFEIFTLEDEASIAAALVVLREETCRRFYTGWFSPQLEKYSPAISLIYEVTRQSLAERLDCDYMTGEQPYKQRLATSAVPLYRVHASADQLKAYLLKESEEVVQAA